MTRRLVQLRPHHRPHLRDVLLHETEEHEACFNVDRFDIGEVVSFLRSATYYVQQNGPVIKDGDTMDGPGGVRWRGTHFDESIAPAPRPVLRWIPLDGAEPPARLR